MGLFLILLGRHCKRKPWWTTEHSYPQEETATLFGLHRGQPEVDTAVIVCFLGRGNVQVGERNLSCLLFTEDPKHLPDDGVILHLFGVTIAKNQLGVLRLTVGS